VQITNSEYSNLLTPLIEKCNVALLQLGSHPVDPSQRIFWLFIISSFLFAVILSGLQGQTRRCLGQFKQLASPTYWLNSDGIKDLCLFITNGFLRVLLLVPIVGGQLAIALMVSRFLSDQFAPVNDIHLPWWFIATLFTLVFFVVEDFSRFVLHAWMHKNRFLWKIHQTHHSAKHLTPLTLYRIHPLEMCLYFFRGVAVFGLVSGFFIYLFKSKLNAWDILGVDALGFLFNLAAANLRHSPVWLSFGRFERWFISPAQHQIHHSSAHEHKNKNFGVSLAVWDRLLGSWHGSGDFQPLNFGLAIHASKSLSD
jgi:sterol desaturase/sphingolipid hydroxylase (fatty acid hydroxylase superfamily)